MREASITTRSKHSFMYKTLIFLTCIALAGCGTTTGPQARSPAALPLFDEQDVADTREARLAAATGRELGRLAREDPELLVQVSGELQALAMALVEHGNADDPMPGPTPSPMVSTLPPDDMLSAPSLRHGLHLASYRIHENAVAGWHELQARYPDSLGGRDARLETVEIDGRGEYLRLKAGPYDSAAEAAQACAALESDGSYCMPVDFSGSPLASR
jgi:hypothetical protein